jgi:purine-cytosine permease-like protein
MPRVLFTLLILLAAMASYLAGAQGASLALLLLGGVLEGWFWVRAWRGGDARSAQAAHAPASIPLSHDR